MSDVNQSTRIWHGFNDMIRYSPGPKSRRRLILNFLTKLSFDSVLDVGCGNGALLELISKKYGTDKDLSGCDASKEVINQNKKQLLKIKFHKLNIEKEFLSEKFDLVICSEVIEHLKNYKNGLTNIAKMSNKYIVITVPSCPIFESDKAVGHIRHFKGQEIGDVFKKIDFKINLVIKWGYPFFNMYKHIINGFYHKKIQSSFASTSDYSLSKKIFCQILYLIFFLNFKNHQKGYQLLIIAEKIYD